MTTKSRHSTKHCWMTANKRYSNKPLSVYKSPVNRLFFCIPPLGKQTFICLYWLELGTHTLLLFMSQNIFITYTSASPVFIRIAGTSHSRQSINKWIELYSFCYFSDCFWKNSIYLNREPPVNKWNCSRLYLQKRTMSGN